MSERSELIIRLSGAETRAERGGGMSERSEVPA
jgi:hypothetical protein